MHVEVLGNRRIYTIRHLWKAEYYEVFEIAATSILSLGTKREM